MQDALPPSTCGEAPACSHNTAWEVTIKQEITELQMQINPMKALSLSWAPNC